jgi:hypothetical protein
MNTEALRWALAVLSFLNYLINITMWLTLIAER